MANRPKPTALKKLAGNPGHYPLNTEEPTPDTGVPEMPKGLRPTARREWKRITRDLMQLGVLTVIDGKALAMYCDAYADWQEAQRDCVKHGLVLDAPVLDDANQPIVIAGRALTVRKVNPAFTVKTSAMKTMKAFLIEFGLTPASRSKLKLPAKKEEDPMGAFLNRGEANPAPVEQHPTNTPPSMPAYFKTGRVDIGRTDS